MTGFRTKSGGRIDRTRTIAFRFDGRSYQGHPGDTLASALLANGVHLMGRSFKYHRPRGPIAAGAEEPNALVSVGEGATHTPNLRATQVELHDGLVAISQNRFPSLAFDVGAINDLVAPILSAGFYYKTFMGPSWAWRRIYEPLIRRAAGLGSAATLPDPAHYAHRYAHCDVLVVGAGAAGLSAALAASAGGARVILADEQMAFGGGLLDETDALIDGQTAAAWVAAAVAELASRHNVTLLSRTTAFGYYAQNFVGLCQRVTDHLASPDPALPRERIWKLRAGRVVLATGAIERPLVFKGNDRPGIMLAGAVRGYIARWGVRPGTRAVLVTNDDGAYSVLADLLRAGIAVAAIADPRAAPGAEAAALAARLGLRVRTGTQIVNTTGHLRVSCVELATETGPGEAVPCDLVLMSGGWIPVVHLFSQSRGKLAFDAARDIFVPGAPAQALTSAGACNGRFGLAAALADGARAGDPATAAEYHVTGEIIPGSGIRAPSAHGFVDFQNDVKASDIRQAVREGFRSIEHVKRFTTTGMATDQGKTSNMNALGIVADALDRPMPAIGLTMFRPPYTPVTFGAFAGPSRGAQFDPARHTPMHGWAAARGAVFEDVGQWKRARYFPKAREDMHAAVLRETRQVRAAAGIFDASTLGKIEVVGPDAAIFMERLYTNAWAKLAPGRCRYGLMLNEAGFVIDDGVVGRLAADRFHVTTTTGGAARVLAHMEDYRQTEFPELRVWLTSITEQWAVIAVQGPKARDILAGLFDHIDLAAMPHMSVREGQFGGVPCRLFRVSFTGELGFEVNVPADYGQAAWDVIWQAGQAFGLTAYGTESMHVLRAEKGYIVVGQETDGTVTPHDLGLDWAVGKTKPDFVGKRSLTRPDMLLADRPQLVGLLTEGPAVVLEEGAQITEAATTAIGTPSLGHVTSSYHSAALGHSIALALVSGGRARIGQTMHVPLGDHSIAVTVTDPVFLDPKGTRLDG